MLRPGSRAFAPARAACCGNLREDRLFDHHAFARTALAAVIAAVTLGGCQTPAQNIALGVTAAVATTYAARSPSNELEQIYYLGVLDPTEQLPQTIYRVTVKGQASAMSNMHFASGWVPANFIDSLNSRVTIDPMKGLGESDVSLVKGKDAQEVNALIGAGRKMVLFGPEGFREVPKEHRLVIVMGQSPDNFFSAVDSALGTVSGVEVERNDSKVQTLLMQALIDAKQERSDLLHWQLRGKDLETAKVE